MDCLHDFDRRVSGSRKLSLIDSPNTGNIAPSLRICNRTSSGELVALLSVLASALTVALAGDHHAAGCFASEISGRKKEVHHGEAVLDAFRMVFDTAGVDSHGPIGF